MKKLLTITCLALLGVLLLPGCSVKKIEYEKEGNKISYRIYQNDHWLKTESTGIKGGMTEDGKFDFAAEGVKSSPSEEFNYTMKTYGDTFVQLARLAAACYSPGTASIPLTPEAADASEVAKLVEAASAAKTAEIAAKSQKQTALIAAQTEAAAKLKEASAAATPAACADGSCSDTTCADGSCSDPAK